MEISGEKKTNTEKEVITCADMKEWQKEVLTDQVSMRDTAESNKAYVQKVLINAAIVLLELRQDKWDYGKVKKQIADLAYELFDMIDEKWTKP